MPNAFHYITLRKITMIREIRVMIEDQNNQLLVNEDVNNILVQVYLSTKSDKSLNYYYFQEKFS